MSLALRERGSFDAGVRLRGLDYFARGCVSILERTLDHVNAVVENNNGDSYAVRILFDPAKGAEPAELTESSCDCPFFEREGQCKHIWATILQLDADDSGRTNGRSSLSLTKPRSSKTKVAERTCQPDWMTELQHLGRTQEEVTEAWGSAKADELTLRVQQIWYVIDISRSVNRESVALDLMIQRDRAKGVSGAIKEFRLDQNSLREISDPVHNKLLAHLLEIAIPSRLSYSYYSSQSVTTVELKPLVQSALLPQLAQTGRLCWRLSSQVPMEDVRFLDWEENTVWEPVIEFVKKPDQREWIITGRLLQRTLSIGGSQAELQQTRPLTDMMVTTAAGLAIFPESLGVVRLEDKQDWVRLLQRKSELRVSFDDHSLFLKQLLQTPSLLRMPLPQDFFPQCANAVCRPRLRLLAKNKLPQVLRGWDSAFGVVDYLYGDLSVSVRNRQAALWNDASSEVIRRDFQAEAAHLRTLAEHRGESLPAYFNTPEVDVKFSVSDIGYVVRKLMDLGWDVEAEGFLIKRPGSFRMGVTSGLDWFELSGHLDFDGTTVALPTLLQAVKSGEHFITLSDGTRGMLPEEWLRRYGSIAGLGEIHEDSIRFKPSQAMILDALLDAQEKATRDRGFQSYCRKLKDFGGITPKSPPRSFQGELRDYQKEGLSWLHFLNDFRLGGCLADDMGLGKTVQVLSLLEARRTRRLKAEEIRRPSLVVVPKSLIFNWTSEAARFAPKLKVVKYTGLERRDQDLSASDVILTTYGTLRQDIMDLQTRQFDYVILDEAQAIKNSDSQAAKACRLLKADHRLAMTGTPVENHLGELWSLFEFLNPGMLGASSAFQKLTAASRNEEERAEAMKALSQALRPFLLRRTKQQVLTELPGKTEQTLFCEMPPKQRKLYNELREYYRVQLSSKIKQLGLKRSKIHVLEALLRLRQAACHQGLIDSKRQNEDSAKLDAILEQLTQISADGHKALVFSQFTSLLAIVRKKLDKLGIRYAYLDGKSSRRQEIVNSFQNDESCPLFLISLKAGGHGLNLTAADYVFILDPWWNPAVEAQAVDRAHRMGQERHVFAYRLICKDTVEERILEMQKNKKELAESIISADASLISALSAEDLTKLLS